MPLTGHSCVKNCSAGRDNSTSARNYVSTYFCTLSWKSGTDECRLRPVNNDLRLVEVFRWAAVVVKSSVIHEYSCRLAP